MRRAKELYPFRAGFCPVKQGGGPVPSMATKLTLSIWGVALAVPSLIRSAQAQHVGVETKTRRPAAQITHFGEGKVTTLGDRQYGRAA